MRREERKFDRDHEENARDDWERAIIGERKGRKRSKKTKEKKRIE